MTTSCPGVSSGSGQAANCGEESITDVSIVFTVYGGSVWFSIFGITLIVVFNVIVVSSDKIQKSVTFVGWIGHDDIEVLNLSVFFRKSCGGICTNCSVAFSFKSMNVAAWKTVVRVSITRNVRIVTDITNREHMSVKNMNPVNISKNTTGCWCAQDRVVDIVKSISSRVCLENAVVVDSGTTVSIKNELGLVGVGKTAYAVERVLVVEPLLGFVQTTTHSK